MGKFGPSNLIATVVDAPFAAVAGNCCSISTLPFMIIVFFGLCYVKFDNLDYLKSVIVINGIGTPERLCPQFSTARIY